MQSGQIVRILWQTQIFVRIFENCTDFSHFVRKKSGNI